MTTFVPSAYTEEIKRLALGLEVVDAERQERVAPLIAVAFDGVPLALPRSRVPRQMGGLLVDDILRRVDRHDSCLFVLLYSKGLFRKAKKESVDLRFLSSDRRYVPRRLTIPLLDPDLIEAADTPGAVAGDPAALGAGRVRTIHLYPGAAYDFCQNTTALRGRVRTAANEPVPWVRVEARWPEGRDGSPGPVVGRAHGDDRGEFLLLISSAASIGPLNKTLTLPLAITVWAPPAPPAVPVFTKENDPLWALPLEPITDPGPGDPVSLGEQRPSTYTVSQTRTISFELGRVMTSDVPPFIF